MHDVEKELPSHAHLKGAALDTRDLGRAGLLGGVRP